MAGKTVVAFEATLESNQAQESVKSFKQRLKEATADVTAMTENEIDIDLTALGFLDPNITVNIIENEVIVRKINITLPDKTENIIKCKNPRCITAEEKDLTPKFSLIDKDRSLYKCEYCDQIYS